MNVLSIRQCRAALRALLVLTMGCVPGPTDPLPSKNPLNATVRTTDDLQFVDAEVHIGVGGVVVWRSNSGLKHSVTPVRHQQWESVEAEGRGVVMLTVPFSAPGVYEYRCDYHGANGMEGRIVVLE